MAIVVSSQSLYWRARGWRGHVVMNAASGALPLIFEQLLRTLFIDRLPLAACRRRRYHYHGRRFEAARHVSFSLSSGTGCALYRRVLL